LSEIASKQQLRLAFLRWAIVTVPLILLLGFVSARIAPAGDDNRWFAMLAKPSVNPPGWVFPWVWTTLYILMGVALAVVIHARGSRLRGAAILVFVVQLALNLIWSPVFFGMHRIGMATLIIAAMLVAAIATTVLFGRIRTLAAWLMVPYLVWISFAGVLCWQIGRLNPDAQGIAPSASSTQVIDL